MIQCKQQRKQTNKNNKTLKSLGGIEKHDSYFRRLLFDSRWKERLFLCGRKAYFIRYRHDFKEVREIFYPSLAIATAETAELALRDAIAAGQVQTLQEAVEELRHIRDEIITAVGGKEV